MKTLQQRVFWGYDSKHGLDIGAEYKLKLLANEVHIIQSISFSPCAILLILLPSITKENAAISEL